MQPFVIDLGLVEEIWHGIERHGDARLQEEKDRARDVFVRIVGKASGEWVQLNPTTTIPVSPEQLARISLDMVRELLAFVTASCRFFDTLKSYRPLTEDEKRIGMVLMRLLAEVQAVVPTNE